MRLHILAALVLVGAGWFVPWGWVRDRIRARSDRAVDRHPVAVALRTLDTDDDLRRARERAQALAIAERLRRREVVAECEFVDYWAMWERR